MEVSKRAARIVTRKTLKNVANLDTAREEALVRFPSFAVPFVFADDLVERAVHRLILRGSAEKALGAFQFASIWMNSLYGGWFSACGHRSPPG
jgi:hypothetical protein